MDRLALCHFNIEEEETKTNFRTLERKTLSANKRKKPVSLLVSNVKI